MRILVEFASWARDAQEMTVKTLQRNGIPFGEIAPAFDSMDPDLVRFIYVQILGPDDANHVSKATSVLSATHGVISAVPEPEALVP